MEGGARDRIMATSASMPSLVAVDAPSHLTTRRDTNPADMLDTRQECDLRIQERRKKAIPTPKHSDIAPPELDTVAEYSLRVAATKAKREDRVKAAANPHIPPPSVNASKISRSTGKPRTVASLPNKNPPGHIASALAQHNPTITEGELTRLAVATRKEEVKLAVTAAEVLVNNVDVCFVLHKRSLSFHTALEASVLDIRDVVCSVFPRCSLNVAVVFVGFEHTRRTDFVRVDSFGTTVCPIPGPPPTSAAMACEMAGGLSWRPRASHVLVHVTGAEGPDSSQYFEMDRPAMRKLRQKLNEGGIGEVIVFEARTNTHERQEPTDFARLIAERSSLLDPVTGFSIGTSQMRVNAQLADCIVAAVNWQLLHALGGQLTELTGAGRDQCHLDIRRNDKWKVTGSEKCVAVCAVSCCADPERLSDIQEIRWELSLRTVQNCSLQMATRPYARTPMFDIFQASIVGTYMDCDSPDVTLHRFRRFEDAGEANIRVYMEMAAVAHWIAKEFMEQLRRWYLKEDDVRLTFLKNHQVSFGMGTRAVNERPGLLTITTDIFRRKLPFHTFSNGFGGVIKPPQSSRSLVRFGELAQAFSHFTWHFTETYHMVVGLQGWVDEEQRTLLLTDPVIHSRNLLKFGTTNFSSPGFKTFFGSHECNEFCRALSLPAGKS